MTARALATGAGYRVVSMPGAPPEVRFPPLLALAAAAVWRAAPRFPDNLPLLKGLGLLAAFGLALVLPGTLRAAGFPAAVAFATAALTAIAPLTLRYATAVASELPFTLLATGALALIARAAGPTARWPAAAAAGALAGLAVLTRTVGVALVAAGALTLLRRGTRRQSFVFVLTAGVLASPWALWLATQDGHGGGAGYLASFAQDGPPGPTQLLEHALALPAAVGLVALPGLADLLPATMPWAVMFCVYGAGLVALACACRGPFGAYVSLTLAVLVAVPWFQPRFLVPLAPLFLASFLSAILPRGPGRRARLVATILLTGTLAAALAGNALQLGSVRATGLPALEETVAAGKTWTDIEGALAWIRSATAPGDVVASFHDPVVYLYTGRPAVQAYPSIWRPAPGQVTDVLAGSGARWLADLPCPEDGVWAGSHAAWRDWMATHRASLTPAYPGPVGVFRVDEALTHARPSGRS